MVHTELWGKKQGLFKVQNHFFKDLFIWHRMTPSLYTCCFVCVFCLWCEISASSVNQSHHFTKFFSFQPWMNSPRLCVEGQITIYYCTDTDPSALLTVSPPLFQFKTILKISILQFHIKVSRPFKYIGGGGVRLLQYLPPGRLGY